MVTFITWDTTTYGRVCVLLVTGLRKEEKAYVLAVHRYAENTQKRMQGENTQTDNNCPVGTITF
jgi:hypothetical protein